MTDKVVLLYDVSPARAALLADDQRLFHHPHLLQGWCCAGATTAKFPSPISSQVWHGLMIVY